MPSLRVDTSSSSGGGQYRMPSGAGSGSAPLSAGSGSGRGAQAGARSSRRRLGSNGPAVVLGGGVGILGSRMGESSTSSSVSETIHLIVVTDIERQILNTIRRRQQLTIR